METTEGRGCCLGLVGSFLVVINSLSRIRRIAYQACPHESQRN